MKVLSSFTDPNVVSDQYDFCETQKKDIQKNVSMFLCPRNEKK